MSAAAKPRTSWKGSIGRQGAIGATFAIAATGLLGMAALATEAGIWLTARRNAQNAADAGAYAGVSSLALRGDASAGSHGVASVAADGVARNGFTDGRDGTTVSVAVGYWNGSRFATPAPAGNAANAVRVEVSRSQFIGLARLFGTAEPTAWGGAVAVIEQGGQACTVTVPPPGNSQQVAGRTNIAGSATVNAPNCLLVSNATGARAINFQGAAAAREAVIGGLRASGQCHNCDDLAAANIPAGYVSNAPPTPNPYADIDQIGMPRFRPMDCVSATYLDAAGRETRATAAVAIELAGNDSANIAPTAVCDDISVGNGQTLTLRPGTYYFNGASLRQTGGRIVCTGCSVGGAGVTLVFTGNSPSGVGSLQITGGTFDLNAPGSGFGVAAGASNGLDGILIYRDDLARPSGAAPDAIRITGNPGSSLFGAIYAPTTHVVLTGTGGMSQARSAAAGCLAVVAGEITFSGNTAINISACEANGTAVARIRYARLAQ